MSKALTDLAARLRALRQYYGLTQQQFAGRVGVSRSHVSEVELNQTKPAADILVGIPRVFPEVRAEWLLTGAGPMIEGGPADPQDVASISEIAARTANGIIHLIRQERKNWRRDNLSDTELEALLLLVPQVFRTAYTAAIRRPGTAHNDALRHATEKAIAAAKVIALP